MRAGRTIEEDAQKILSIFTTYKNLKRKQVVFYSQFSDRKVRDLIKYLRCEYLPSFSDNTHTIIFNPETRFYEYTDSVEKIKMAKAFHKSYADSEWENISALDIMLGRINRKADTDKQLTMRF